MINKINNQQRKNLCTLVDVRAKASIEKLNVDSSDHNMLMLVSSRLKKHKDYAPLQKIFDALEKKQAKKKADIQAKVDKMHEELKVITDCKDEVRLKIELIGIKPSTGLALHDRKWVGRHYRSNDYKTTMFGENKTVWEGILKDFHQKKNEILKGAVTTKEQIWLADSRQEAENLIKG